MASLQKRGRYYYGRWIKKIDGERVEVKKSLGLRYKNKARDALEKLEELQQHGEINPYSSNFDPIAALQEVDKKETRLNIRTVRKAADYFYKKKRYLSNSSVHNAKKRTMNNSGTYERVIEYFIKTNDIADLSPRLVQQHHFERVIFRDIKPATMHFYFRHLRAWWNKLLDWGVVQKNYPALIKRDLPDEKSNVRQKMLTENELQVLFDAFDDDLKKKQKHWHDDLAQHWFKPLMAVYFYCGLRKHEAAFSSELPYSRLQYDNLYFKNGRPVLIDLAATKGPKERSVPIPAACYQYLEKYLSRRGSISYGDYVFVYTGTRRKGFPVTGARAYRQFKHYLALANLPKARTIHGMRHRRVTTWLENGFNTSEAQFMAGHSNVKTTENYTHLTGMNLLEKMQRMEENK